MPSGVVAVKASSARSGEAAGTQVRSAGLTQVGPHWPRSLPDLAEGRRWARRTRTTRPCGRVDRVSRRCYGRDAWRVVARPSRISARVILALRSRGLESSSGIDRAISPVLHGRNAGIGPKGGVCHASTTRSDV